MTIQQLKVGALRLYEEQDAFQMISGLRSQEKLLRSVIDQNLYGKLPFKKYFSSELDFKDTAFERAKNELILKGLLLQASVAEVVEGYHYFKGSIITVEKSIETALGYATIRNLVSRRRNWDEKFKGKNLNYLPRCYIALIAQQGIPVFTTIFPGLHYTSLATLQDAPLFIKYYPNLINEAAFGQTRLAAKNCKREN